MVLEIIFQDRFADAGLAEDEAKAALLAMDAQGFEDGLLVIKKFTGFFKWVVADAKIGADHIIF